VAISSCELGAREVEVRQMLRSPFEPHQFLVLVTGVLHHRESYQQWSECFDFITLALGSTQNVYNAVTALNSGSKSVSRLCSVMEHVDAILNELSTLQLIQESHRGRNFKALQVLLSKYVEDLKESQTKLNAFQIEPEDTPINNVEGFKIQPPER